jgi:hypothetical protein
MRATMAWCGCQQRTGKDRPQTNDSVDGYKSHAMHCGSSYWSLRLAAIEQMTACMLNMTPSLLCTHHNNEDAYTRHDTHAGDIKRSRR